MQIERELLSLYLLYAKKIFQKCMLDASSLGKNPTIYLQNNIFII